MSSSSERQWTFTDKEIQLIVSALHQHANMLEDTGQMHLAPKFDEVRYRIVREWKK